MVSCYLCKSDCFRAAATAALMMGEEIQKFGRCRLDRNDLVNPASRQIYLTFPADSTFREDDVSSYFRFVSFFLLFNLKLASFNKTKKNLN